MLELDKLTNEQLMMLLLIKLSECVNFSVEHENINNIVNIQLELEARLNRDLENK